MGSSSLVVPNVGTLKHGRGQRELQDQAKGGAVTSDHSWEKELQSLLVPVPPGVWCHAGTPAMAP